jgi:chromosome segregation ATPase
MQAPASSQADAPVDVSPDERWMTLVELGQMRGISKASAARLVRRHRWRRQADNQGRVRVLVPIDALTQADVRLTDRADAGADMSAAIGTLREAVAALREQLTRAEAGREAEHARADALREQLDEMQAALDQARRDAQAGSEGPSARKCTIRNENTDRIPTILAWSVWI